MLATDVTTHKLAIYTVDGTERSLIAAEHARDHLEILDVREDPDGGDPDAIRVEPRVFTLREGRRSPTTTSGSPAGSARPRCQPSGGSAARVPRAEEESSCGLSAS